MTDDLDHGAEHELARRLHRLASAVPVEAPPAALRRPPVRAERTLLRIGWATPLVAVVVVAAFVIGRDVLAPAGTQPPGASTGTLPDMGVHVVNLDRPSIDIVVGDEVVATVQCGTTVVLSLDAVAGGLPWEVEVRETTGGDIGSVTVEGPLPRAILVRNGTALTGPWPMSFGPAPAPTCPPEAGEAVVGTATVGPYSIELRSERAVYRESDLIRVTGTFEYSGQVANAVQGFKSGFAVLEPVHGISMHPAHTLECNHVTFEPGYRVVAPFAKSGGVSSSDPQYDLKLAYLRDPEFRLPPGTWHLQYTAFWNEDECGSEATRISTEIVIVVLAEDSATPR